MCGGIIGNLVNKNEKVVWFFSLLELCYITFELISQ